MRHASQSNKGNSKMKTSFLWSWNDRAPWPDENMTRARAARLLRAWRATSRRPSSMGFFVRHLERRAPGVYRVTDCASGETGTMIIKRT
jgi:hypothetical protein